MMEIKVQKCQNCKSRKCRNILYRTSGETDRVFVQCLKCGELVASYHIAPMGYYHHGKGYESFLRGIHRGGDFMSGRNIAGMFTKRQKEETELFQKALGDLAARKKESKE